MKVMSALTSVIALASAAAAASASAAAAAAAAAAVAAAAAAAVAAAAAAWLRPTEKVGLLNPTFQTIHKTDTHNNEGC